MARFFHACSEIEYANVLNFVLSHYATDFIFTLPYQDGIAVILQGIKQYQEEHLFQLYCALYPNMNSENYISFDQFKAEATAERPDPKSQEEIMGDVEDILRMYTGG